MTVALYQAVCGVLYIFTSNEVEYRMSGIQNKHEIAKVLRDLLSPSTDTDVPVFFYEEECNKS